MQIAVIHAHRRAVAFQGSSTSSQAIPLSTVAYNSTQSDANMSSAVVLPKPTAVNSVTSRLIEVQYHGNSSLRPAQSTSSLTNSKASSSSLKNAATGTVVVSSGAIPSKKKAEILRIEALLDRSSPSYEANLKMLQNFVNSARIKEIIKFAQSMQSTYSTFASTGKNVPAAITTVTHAFSFTGSAAAVANNTTTQARLQLHYTMPKSLGESNEILTQLSKYEAKNKRIGVNNDDERQYPLMAEGIQHSSNSQVITANYNDVTARLQPTDAQVGSRTNKGNRHSSNNPLEQHNTLRNLQEGNSAVGSPEVSQHVKALAASTTTIGPTTTISPHMFLRTASVSTMQPSNKSLCPPVPPRLGE